MNYESSQLWFLDFVAIYLQISVKFLKSDVVSIFGVESVCNSQMLNNLHPILSAVPYVIVRI